jgi:hypothetical protein
LARGSASRSAGCFAAPKSLPLFSVPIAFRGRTGPTASLAGDCSSGPGRATGMPWLLNNRRKSCSTLIVIMICDGQRGPV